MTTVSFDLEGERIVGFRVRGHSGYAEAGEDIVCAAVSSAAYMTANTVTEIVGAPAAIEVDDGYMHVVATDAVDACQVILQGFLLHMQQMQTQYPSRVHLTITEV